MPFASGEAVEDKNFILSGGNSMQAAQITCELSKYLNISYEQLSIELIFKYPKIGDFIEEIWKLIKNKEENKNYDKEGKKKNFDKNLEENERETSKLEAPIKTTKESNPQTFLPLLLPLRNETATSLNHQKLLNIFCIHPISGSAILYRHLTNILPLWASAVGVQFASEAESSTSSLVELAEYYAEKDRFHHFAPNQLNSLANGAEKLAGFLRKHHFTSNIEHSPEIWLFTAEEKTKLMFRPLKINSLYGPSTQLLIIQRLQKLGSVKMADWLVYRNFLEQADLNTFVHERMAGWHIDPRCRAVTREVGTVLHRTAYYTCSQDILGCTARLKIVTETSTTASREFIIGTVLIGRGGHTNHPPFEMGRMEAFIDGRQV
ncbi:hypothetical protein ACQ4LE_010815 [Meloidogyne hapla]